MDGEEEGGTKVEKRELEEGCGEIRGMENSALFLVGGLCHSNALSEESNRDKQRWGGKGGDEGT